MHVGKSSLWVAIVVVVVSVAASGCGGTTAPRVSIDGSGVIQDLRDGKLGDGWSCGSLRAALVRLPGGSVPPYAQEAGLVAARTGGVCAKAVSALRIGTTSASDVRLALGEPDARGPGKLRCWFYMWPSVRVSTTASARLCFDGVRINRVQIAPAA